MPFFTSSDGSGQNPKHLDGYETLVITLIGIVVFGGFWSWKFLNPEDLQGAFYKSAVPKAAYQIKRTPVKTASKATRATPKPRTNPFENTNPLSQYENPFK